MHGDLVPWASAPRSPAAGVQSDSNGLQTRTVGAKVRSGVPDLNLNTIDVNSTTPDAPVAGKRFGIWNNLKDNGTDDDGIAKPVGGFIEFTILSVAGISGAFIITIDTNQSGSLTFVDTARTPPSWPLATSTND